MQTLGSTLDGRHAKAKLDAGSEFLPSPVRIIFDYSMTNVTVARKEKGAFSVCYMKNTRPYKSF